MFLFKVGILAIPCDLKCIASAAVTAFWTVAAAGYGGVSHEPLKVHRGHLKVSPSLSPAASCPLSWSVLPLRARSVLSRFDLSSRRSLKSPVSTKPISFGTLDNSVSSEVRRKSFGCERAFENLQRGILPFQFRLSKLPTVKGLSIHKAFKQAGLYWISRSQILLLRCYIKLN